MATRKVTVIREMTVGDGIGERRRFAINRRWSRTFGLLSQVLNQPVWILHRKFYDAF